MHEVQGAIAQQHAGWRAADNWVSRLSKAELQRMFGLQKPPQGNLDFESIHNGREVPGGVDWRNVNGVNWLGPVMNQGNCGSCVAFATVATLEGQTSISAGIPFLRPTYSPQMLFACGGGGCETGWMPDDAASFLQQTGVPDEACMPYTSGSTGLDADCNTKCADADSRSTKIAGSSTPTNYGGSVDTVKAALKNGPLVTTLSVYADFVTYAGGVYKHVTGSFLGGHAVSLVGYDDTKKAWLIRNSWGQEWGESGFAWISWSDASGVGANTWAFQLPTAAGHLTVTSPADREYVSGQYQMVAQGKGFRGQDVRFHLRGSDAHDLAVIDCATLSDQGCSAPLDTTQLKEGRYEIFAESGTTANVKSQIREFFVLNSEPKLSISFTPADGTDLGAPLTGRPEFVIKTAVNPVPMQHIEFRAIDSTGKIAAIKSNDQVLEQMKMGWRVMTVPNGKYTILFHGETKYNGKVYAADSNTYSVTVKN